MKQRFISYGRGGWRPGAGRPVSKRRNKIVLHRQRPQISTRTPGHVGLRVHRELTSLRTKGRCKVIRKALAAVASRDNGFRIIDWSIQATHIHLLVEADSAAQLSRGMQGFCIQVARGLNRAAGRRGKVFTERYYLRLLRTPAEVRAARVYVLLNYRRHTVQAGRPVGLGLDPNSSWAWFDGWKDLNAPIERLAARERDGPALVSNPRDWLLREGWRRGRGLVSMHEKPAAWLR